MDSRNLPEKITNIFSLTTEGVPDDTPSREPCELTLGDDPQNGSYPKGVTSFPGKKRCAVFRNTIDTAIQRRGFA